MREFSVALKINDGCFLASSYETMEKLIPGCYSYNLKNDGMFFRINNIDDSKIILDEIQSSIYNKIMDFWSKRSEYLNLRIAHKRGFLLYGPPGTGKTTLMKYVIKDHISSGGIILNLGSVNEFKSAMRAVKDLNGQESRLIVYIEDIDEYDDEDLSTLMDGANSVDNTLFIATTNYIESVSDRLCKRPSRFDEIIELGYPSESSRESFIRGLGDSMSEDDIKFITSISDGISNAHIKELIIKKLIYKVSDEDLKELSNRFQLDCLNNKKDN